MPILSGQSENGWTKSSTTSGLTRWTSELTHTSSTSSNQTTSILPSEVIHHIFKEFSNIHLNVNWGAGTKSTTFNLIICPADNATDILQTKELSASASRANAEFGATILPRNLYSSDGAFVETTHIMSPIMFFQDLSNSHHSSTGTNTVTISLFYAPGKEEEKGLIHMGDVFRGF
tara:strand:+ start:3401 stop:3925 length:525 start_codon:yes stop_codon:yes gene_type:complete